MLKFPIGIVACDIVREADGLAMSSRNALLSTNHRAIAPQIYSTLQTALKEASHFTPAEVKRHVTDRINSLELLQVEYFEIVNELTLEAISSWDQMGTKVGCIAVFAGKVRLIDNIVFAK